MIQMRQVNSDKSSLGIRPMLEDSAHSMAINFHRFTPLFTTNVIDGRVVVASAFVSQR